MIKQARLHGLQPENFQNYDAAVRARTGKPTIELPSKRKFASAELFHYFYDCLSPIDPTTTRIVLARFYRTGKSVEEINVSLKRIMEELQLEAILDLNAGYARETASPYVRVELKVEKRIDLSIDHFLNNGLRPTLSILEKIDQVVKGHLNDAQLATVEFMRDVVGFRITDSDFSGNPWVILGNKKISWGDFEKVVENQGVQER